MATYTESEIKLRKKILAIAIPISLQSLFQSSLSVIDQIMVGQIGTNSIAAIGIGAKFSGFFIVTLSAIASAASIMISQYNGKKDTNGMNLAFFSNGFLACLITLAFFIPSFLFPSQIMGLFTTDSAIIPLSADYLKIISIGYIPLLFTIMLSTIMRNTGKAKYPMFAGIFSVILNTLLNFILIFGKFGAPKLDLIGAGIATTIARTVEFLLLLFFFFKSQKNSYFKLNFTLKVPKLFLSQTIIIATPIIMSEFLWGLGETLYAVIYGRIGTKEMAAMTLTGPIQFLTIGLFTGVSSAAAIIVGNQLGKNKNEIAYKISKKFLKIGFFGSLILAVLLFFLSNIYASLFNIDNVTKNTTISLLFVFGGFLFVKVSNMILGGILKSGGKTKYTLGLDIIGTWGVGIPLGLLSAFVWKMPVHWVYLLITTEEVVRLTIGMIIFKSKKWIKNITTSEN